MPDLSARDRVRRGAASNIAAGGSRPCRIWRAKRRPGGSMSLVGGDEQSIAQTLAWLAASAGRNRAIVAIGRNRCGNFEKRCYMTDMSTSSAPSGRRIQAADHLSAPVGDRPLRSALHLLHARKDEVPAAQGSAEPRRAAQARAGLHRPRDHQDPPDRRRAAGAARHDRAGPRAGPQAGRWSGRTDADHQWHPARRICQATWPKRA